MSVSPTVRTSVRHKDGILAHKNVLELLQTWNLEPRHNSQNQDKVKSHGWLDTITRMVTHHPKDGHPPTKIYQKEEYNRLGI